MKILAATNNSHKLHELRTMLSPLGLEILSAKDVGGIPEVIEDADSFAGNASKKACEVAKELNIACLSDDSGLCVDALNGEPGIYSARYGGPGLDDHGRCLKLLESMATQEDRKAHFACVIAFAMPNGSLFATSEGLCKGSLATELSGKGGFGYDPMFIPGGYAKSFAELGEEIKNKVSHRKLALENAIEQGVIERFIKANEN